MSYGISYFFPAFFASIPELKECFIRSFYRIPYGESDAVCVIPVNIPAGASYTYDLEWTEVWREGIFELGKPDGQGEGTYRFRQSMLCEVVGQVADDCAGQ